MIPALLSNITGIGQMSRSHKKHIIVDNSGMTDRRNVKLVPNYS